MESQNLWGFEVTVQARAYHLQVSQSKWFIMIPSTTDYQAYCNYEWPWLITLL